MGSLAKELGKDFGFSPEFITEIEEVVKVRNYLAHDYFRLNSQIVLTDDGKRRMIKDFVEFRQRVKTVDARLEALRASNFLSANFLLRAFHTSGVKSRV